MNQNNERWLTDGKCSECRRKNYCSKACSAHKRRIKALVFSAADEATGGMLSYTLSRTLRR
jgi:radical SAM protein with 4Fe4S-binding SPASM domain